MERGGKAYAGQRSTSAAGEYEAAFLRALATDEPMAAGDAAYNLSMIYALQGNYDKGLLYLSLAMSSVRSAGAEPAERTSTAPPLRWVR